MKRTFVKKPILASEEKQWWSTDVTTEKQVKQEIQKALDAGTTLDDIDDYLNELYNMGKIDDEQFSSLINWASLELTDESEEWWSTDVRNAKEVEAEIRKAARAGTSIDDIDDYLLDVCDSLHIIDEGTKWEIHDWALQLLDAMKGV